jgi:hypothetical protein
MQDFRLLVSEFSQSGHNMVVAACLFLLTIKPILLELVRSAPARRRARDERPAMLQALKSTTPEAADRAYLVLELLCRRTPEASGSPPNPR